MTFNIYYFSRRFSLILYRLYGGKKENRLIILLLIPEGIVMYYK